MFWNKTPKDKAAKPAAAAPKPPPADDGNHSFHFLTDIDGLVDPEMDEAERFNSYEILGARTPEPLVRLYHTHQHATVTYDERGLTEYIEKSRAEGIDTRVTEHALETLRTLKS